MSERYVYAGDDGFWVDAAESEPGSDPKDELFMEVDVGEVLNQQDAELTTLRARNEALEKMAEAAKAHQQAMKASHIELWPAINTGVRLDAALAALKGGEG